MQCVLEGMSGEQLAVVFKCIASESKPPGICFEACFFFYPILPFKHRSMSSEQKELVFSAVGSLDSSEWVILGRWVCYGCVVMPEWGNQTWLAIVFMFGCTSLTRTCDSSLIICIIHTLQFITPITDSV